MTSIYDYSNDYLGVKYASGDTYSVTKDAFPHQLAGTTGVTVVDLNGYDGYDDALAHMHCDVYFCYDESYFPNDADLRAYHPGELRPITIAFIVLSALLLLAGLFLCCTRAFEVSLEVQPPPPSGTTCC